MHIQSFFLCSLCHPFLCTLLPSLSNVLCPLSYVSVPCLSSYVPSITSLFLAFRPLSYVSRLCSLSPVPCPLYYLSVPCLPSSVPCLTFLFLGSGPLYPVSLSRDLSPVSQSPSRSYATPLIILKKICRHMKYKDFTFMQAFKLFHIEHCICLIILRSSYLQYCRGQQYLQFDSLSRIYL